MKKALHLSAESRVLNFWLRVLAVFLAFGLWLPAGFAAEGYRAYAEQLFSQVPEGVQISPDVEKMILQSLNDYRKSKGRKPIALASEDLVMAARAHALDLLAMGKVGHVASTGHDFESRMRALKGGGLVMLPAMSENAARDKRAGMELSAKAKAIMQQWIDSPRHRKSLTDRSYVAVAIGAVQRGDVIYAVQIFVGPEGKNNLFN